MLILRVSKYLKHESVTGLAETEGIIIACVTLVKLIIEKKKVITRRYTAFNFYLLVNTLRENPAAMGQLKIFYVEI